MDKSKFRSSQQWKNKRAEILLRDHNQCKICGGNNNLLVHHIYALDIAPELKLENTNLITLCDQCHHNTHNQVYSTIYLTKLINET